MAVMPIITSLHNDRIKLIRALQSHGKTRRAEKRIVLEGTRLINDALDSGTFPTFALYTVDSIAEGKLGGSLFDTLRSANIESFEVSQEIMTQVSDTQSPQGWMAVFPMPELEPPANISLALILDGVSDPGNMGTILRTAVAASVEMVVLAPYCVDPYNPKVLRGGMGAHFRVPLRRMFWPDIATRFGTHSVYLTDARAELSYAAVDWNKPSAIIIGGEARGADERARQIAGNRISIPMAEGAESLNAAVAAGVILFEARRQRTLD